MKYDFTVIYLAAGYSVLNSFNKLVIHNDLCVSGNDIICDMMLVDLSAFDILIASPPCNYWSKANYRRNVSDYALSTKHLLPDIINKFILTGKPFIVENVINKKLMAPIINSLPFDVFYFEIGRHSYFSNINFDYSDLTFPCEHISHLSSKARQGAGGVSIVFARFLNSIKKKDSI